MLNKNKIKQIQSLRLPKYRKSLGLFTAEGSRLVLDFLENGNQQVKEIFASNKWLTTYGNRYAHVPQREVTPEEMKKISHLKNPSEVLAIVSMPEQEKTIVPQRGAWSLVLDGIRDPGNLGTIIRTAEWFGIENIFCSLDTVDAYNPKVVQATMGSLARISVVYADLERLFQTKGDEIPVYGTLLEGQDIASLDHPQPGMILIGSEAHGISKDYFSFIDYRITVPPAEGSKAESLNASIAAAVVCYGLIRE